MKTLLIDGHSFFLGSFGAALLQQANDLSVVCVETARAAFEVLSLGHSFDLVLLNLQQDNATGFEILAELRNSYPLMPVVVASSVDTNAEIVRAIYLGAAGFVPKSAGTELFLEAVAAVRAGRIFMPPMFARPTSPPQPAALVPLDDIAGNVVPGTDFASSGWTDLVPMTLTRRQTDVLGLLMEGQSNKAMARLLNLSVDTVKDHVAAVLRTLNVRSRTQAVLAVSRMAQAGGRAGPRPIGASIGAAPSQPLPAGRTSRSASRLAFIEP
jgi:DNA-binding NarL/FixJ family response regulator